jgi:electron transfer flavoprotein alpha subunit
MPGILIFGEHSDGHVSSITGELIAAARTLAQESGDEVAVALIGGSVAGMASDAASFGSDKVYVVESPTLAELQPDAVTAAFEQVCRQTGPAVVLIGRTETGRELGPRLAFRLGVGLAQDCVSLAFDTASRRVVATRPVYGGNAMARVTFPAADPQIVVVRAKVFEPMEPDASRTAETQSIDVQLDASVVRARVVERVKGESEGIRLEDARIVVGGGRGMGGPDSFAQLEELAKILGGAVGASRAVCDAGWMPHNYQIGLTGKTISPEIYITVGTSGASQHMAGCSGSKHIVAINRDKDANIFDAASFGVVGEWQEVLPAFIETVRELVQS